MSENKNAPRRHRGPMMGPPMMRGGEKPKNFKGTMKNLFKYIKPFWVSVLIVLIFASLSSAFAIVGPKQIGKATTILFNGLMAKMAGTGEIDFDAIAEKLLFLVGLYVISSLLMAFQSFIITGVSQKISFQFRKNISEKINKLPLKYFDSVTHGEIMSRVTNDVDTVSQTLSQSLSQMISAATTLVGALIMMLSISLQMTLIALVTIPFSLAFIMIIVKRSQKYFKQQQEYLGKVNGQVEESYGGHNVIKAFNCEARSVEEFDEHNTALYNVAWKSQFLSGILMPLMQFVGNLGYVFVCIFGGVLAAKKSIEVGDIVSFVQYVRNFNQPITQVAQIANTLQSTAAAAERVFEFLNQNEETETGNNKLDQSKIEGSVEFRNVSFGYENDKPVIHNFSTKIQAGKKVAIVGKTGAGKTTIVKLLMRFYELNSGSILVDGVNISDYPRKELRDIFGMVLQDAWLFNGSIKENIRYGNMEKSDKDVENAARAAHVHRFIRTLPNGYDMIINEESSNISQGQKQLLTIARAVLSDPKILILDEATSSVDTRTEVLIQQAMEELMKNRTSFIIAHRLSTIRNADMILVMDNGDIVEQGSHEELLEKKGHYFDLYNSQFDDPAM